MAVAPSRTQKRTFGVLFAAAAFLFLWTVAPIWVPVFLGVLLAVVATPLQRRIARKVHGHERLIAAVLTALTVAIGTGLVFFIGFVVVRALAHFLAAGQAHEVARHLVAWLHTRRMTALLDRLGDSPDHVIAVARSHAANLSSHLTAIVSGLVSFTSNGLLTLVLTIVTGYYLLLEGRPLTRFLLGLLPLPAEETSALVAEFREAMVGIVLGIFAIAIYQGVVTGLGCLLFGVGKPLVWGSISGVVSLVPVVGTAIICIPLGIILLATGHIAAGIGFLVYWAVVVAGLADYVLRPWVMKGRMRLHSLLVLLSLFGGIEAFGPMGLALGPLFCALFVALLRIYDRDYRPARPRTA